MLKKILIGYGNPDRGDDGVAWHLLNAILEKVGGTHVDIFSTDIIPVKIGLDIMFNLQLLPEMAETIATYDQAIFIDAHTGEIKEEISFKPIQPAFQNSPFTHHFTPASCLALVDSMTGGYPQSWLLSVRGYQFEFNRQLSAKTKKLVNKSLKILQVEFLQ